MTKNPPTAPETSSTWLGLPDLAALLPSTDVENRIGLAARATGTAVRLSSSTGATLAEAGQVTICGECGGAQQRLLENVSSPAQTVEACPHGFYVLQTPVMVESSRAANLSFGPLSASPDDFTRPQGSVERVAAVAGLTASLIAADLTAALIRATRDSAGLPREEERLRLALEATSDAIWDWDLRTDRTYFSPRWFTMLGYAPGAFDPTFETWERMTLPGDVEHTKALIRKALEGDSSYEAEFCMRHADGGLRWILGRGRVSERDGQGRPIRMSGTNTDITERKRVQAEQAALEARLQKAERLAAMGQLAGGIAHDFNNQLTVVLGNATVLRNHLREPHEVNLLDNLVSAASRTAQLTQKMLAFARLDHTAGTRVDINALVLEVISIASADASVRVEQDLEANPSLVRGDASALSSAMLGLAFNAREAMPNGGTLRIGTRAVWLDAERARKVGPKLGPGPYLEISFADEGTGISPDVRAHLFEPFFTTKPAGQGTGMGLAAAYGTVRSHGGAIEVESELGKGATFRIYLPYEAFDSQRPDALTSTEDKPSSTPPKAQQRVLVVDDEPLVRQALAALIQAFGYAVECSADGPSAIAALKAREDIGLVILDLVLPGMGGAAIFRAMRELRPDLKLLVSSGYADSDDCMQLVSEGAAGVLAKPFRAEELSRTLESILGPSQS